MSGTLWAHHRAPTPNVLSGGSVRPGGRARFRPLLCAVRKKESPQHNARNAQTQTTTTDTPHTAVARPGRGWDVCGAGGGWPGWIGSPRPTHSYPPPRGRHFGSRATAPLRFSLPFRFVRSLYHGDQGDVVPDRLVHWPSCPVNAPRGLTLAGSLGSPSSSSSILVPGDCP